MIILQAKEKKLHLKWDTKVFTGQDKRELQAIVEELYKTFLSPRAPIHLQEAMFNPEKCADLAKQLYVRIILTMPVEKARADHAEIAAYYKNATPVLKIERHRYLAQQALNENDFITAETEFKNAERCGDPNARLFLGQVYLDRDNTVNQDIPLGLKLVEEYIAGSESADLVTESDKAGLRLLLARIYSNEEICGGKFYDPGRAGKYYAYAANYEYSLQGPIKSAYSMMFEFAKFLEHQTKAITAEAEHWYQRAGERGFFRAYSMLGNYHYEAKKDVAMAEGYYRKAVALGSLDATINLAQLLYHHHQKYAEAFKLFNSIAPDAKPARGLRAYFLGKLHLAGLGTEKSLVMAERYFWMAARGGFFPAYEEILKLLVQMYVESLRRPDSEEQEQEQLSHKLNRLRILLIEEGLFEEDYFSQDVAPAPALVVEPEEAKKPVAENIISVHRKLDTIICGEGAPREKIVSLLDLFVIFKENRAVIFNRLGKLVHQHFNSIVLAKYLFPKILAKLQNLADQCSQFNPKELLQVIQAASRLPLDSDKDPSFKAAVTALYAEACKRIPMLRPNQLAALILYSSRINGEAHKVYTMNIVDALRQKFINCDTQGITNLAYGITILHANDYPIPLDFLQPLLRRLHEEAQWLLEQLAKGTEEAGIYYSSHQAWTTLFYFLNNNNGMAADIFNLQANNALALLRSWEKILYVQQAKFAKQADKQNLPDNSLQVRMAEAMSSHLQRATGIPVEYRMEVNVNGRQIDMAFNFKGNAAPMLFGEADGHTHFVFVCDVAQQCLVNTRVYRQNHKLTQQLTSAPHVSSAPLAEGVQHEEKGEPCVPPPLLRVSCEDAALLRDVARRDGYLRAKLQDVGFRYPAAQLPVTAPGLHQHGMAAQGFAAPGAAAAVAPVSLGAASAVAAASTSASAVKSPAILCK